MTLSDKILNEIINFREEWLSCGDISPPTDEEILKKVIEITIEYKNLEFKKIIKKLKMRLKNTNDFKYLGRFSYTEVIEVIDKLAGDKLI